MDVLDGIRDAVRFFFWTFAFVAYLMVLFLIIGDLFRDRELGGFATAVWLLFLLFVPFITALVDVIVRGKAASLSESGSIAADEYASLREKALH